MAFEKTKYKSGEHEGIFYEINKVEGQKGHWFEFEVWSKTFEWDGKTCKDRKFTLKNLYRLKETLDIIAEEVDEAKAASKETKFKAEPAKGLSFEDDDVPF